MEILRGDINESTTIEIKLRDCYFGHRNPTHHFIMFLTQLL